MCRCLAMFLVALVASTSVALAEEPARIVAGISSADDVFRELEFLVAKMAGKKTAYEKSLKENLEYFLIGVDPARPVRFDALLSETGYRSQPIIPVSNLKEFLNDNLNPIGIIPKLDRRDKGLYELTGEVYPGWLRSVPGDDAYVVINKVKEEIPKDMPHPSALHAELVKAGYLAFADMQNSADEAASREKAFDKFSQDLLDRIQKRTDETREAYELRKKWREQQLLQFRQWFVECSRVRLGLKVDEAAQTSTADVLFAAAAGTNLATSIDQVAERGSYFGSLAKPEKSVLSIRVNWPIDEATRKRYDEIYQMSGPVAEQAIRKDEKSSDAVKDARVEFSQLLIDVFRQSASVGAVDLFADLVPTEKHHRLVLGVRCTGHESLTKALAQLPIAEPEWGFKADVGEVEGVKLHELSVSNSLTPAVQKFYGEQGVLYFGVSEEAFWLAAGDGAREALEAAIKQVKSAGPGQPDQVLASVHLQALPLLQSMDDMSKESGFNLLDELRSRGLLSPKGAKKPAEKKEEKTERADKRQERAQQLANFNWRPTALASLQQLDGEFDLVLKRTEAGTLNGTATSTAGILRALGSLIAEFAETNLK